MKHTTTLLLAIVVFCFSLSSLAQPVIEWNKTFGTSGNEVLHGIQATTDGNYIVLGIADVNGGDVACDLKGFHDAWVFKIDPSGSIIWQQCFGGSKEEANPNARIIQTSDGGYLFITESWSYDFDAIGHHNESDVLTMKLDASGNTQWVKSFGGTHFDVPRDILELSGHRYAILSRSTSSDGDVPPNIDTDEFDAWLFIIDSVGNIIGNHIYGGKGDDDMYKVLPGDDSSLVLFGFTNSDDGDLAGLGVDSTDAWVLKVDMAGNIISNRVYGGHHNDKFTDALPAIDGGYIAFGILHDSIPVDQGQYHGGEDFWAVKLDDNGNVLWQGSYGGSNDESFKQAVVANDNSGYYLAGGAGSTDGDVIKPFNHGRDCWAIKIGIDGKLKWSVTSGGTKDDYFNSIASDACAAGVAYSLNGDIVNAQGNGDGWIVKYIDDGSCTLFISPTITNASCQGNDGSIHLSVSGGDSPYTYSWSNGKTTQSVNALTAGTYSVVVTDNSGCTSNALYHVAPPVFGSPVNLTTVQITPTSALLKWVPQNQPTGYRIQYGLAPGSYSANLVLDAKRTAFKITGLSPGTQYKWHIKELCAGTLSGWSGEKTFTTLPLKLDQNESDLNSDLNVYPNPTNGVFTVEGNIFEDRVFLCLTDFGGRIMWEKQLQQDGKLSYQVSLNSLPQGLYLMHVSTSHESYVLPVAIVK